MIELHLPPLKWGLRKSSAINNPVVSTFAMITAMKSLQKEEFLLKQHIPKCTTAEATGEGYGIVMTIVTVTALSKPSFRFSFKHTLSLCYSSFLSCK